MEELKPADRLHSHCLRCGRRLKQTTAMRLGYGKICHAKACKEAERDREAEKGADA